MTYATTFSTRSNATKMVCVALTTLLPACGTTRVLLVPRGDPVRLAEPVRAHVWVPDGKGVIVRSRNRVEIPAGWYALPKD
jgi:hypothetical protein